MSNDHNSVCMKMYMEPMTKGECKNVTENLPLNGYHLLLLVSTFISFEPILKGHQSL